MSGSSNWKASAISANSDLLSGKMASICRFSVFTAAATSIGFPKRTGSC